MGKFRKGDRVTVEAIIASEHVLDRGSIRVEFGDHMGDAFVNVASLTMKQPVIKVDDLITCFEQGTGVATVLAVANEHAWVDLGGGNFATWWLPKVERVDPESRPQESIQPPEITT
jgi:hypothetical protein